MTRPQDCKPAPMHHHPWNNHSKRHWRFTPRGTAPSALPERAPSPKIHRPNHAPVSWHGTDPVSYTHLRAHETSAHL
eukprot:5582154-Alexandrium_andersonii.AAC.1